MRSMLLCTAVAAAMALGACSDGSGPRLGGEERSLRTRSFMEIGTGLLNPEPTWLDDDSERAAAIQELTDAAATGNVEPTRLGHAIDALERPAADGARTAAFFLSGCEETGARLTIEGSQLNAELTGGENINCAMAVNFLAIFEIPEQAIPADARLS
jgi:hypothetical protein